MGKTGSDGMMCCLMTKKKKSKVRNPSERKRDKTNDSPACHGRLGKGHRGSYQKRLRRTNDKNARVVFSLLYHGSLARAIAM